MLSICKAFDLIVANGRCPGDMIGNFTCHTKRGASVVDLIIIDSQIFNLISKVKVLPPSFVSAHSPVSFSLKCIIQKGNLNKEVLANNYAKLIWDPEKKDLIQNIFKFPMVKQEVNLINQELNSIDNNYKMLDSIIQKFCNLLILKASTCLKLKKKIVSRNVYSKKPKINKNTRWYDLECNSIKKRLRNLANILNKNPNDQVARSNWFKIKKEYRRTIRNKKQLFEQESIDKLISSVNEPKVFWKHAKRINSKSGGKNSNTILA